MIELTKNADLALKKIHGLRRLPHLNPELLQKAEKRVLQNLNLQDLAIVAAVVLAEEQAGQ